MFRSKVGRNGRLAYCAMDVACCVSEKKEKACRDSNTFVVCEASCSKKM